MIEAPMSPQFKLISLCIILGSLVFLFLSLIRLPQENSLTHEVKGSMHEEVKPNIIVIMTDDLDVKTLNVALEKNLMPHLTNYVVKGGTTFTQAFVTNPLCCPSRATFLTGNYSHNHKVSNNEAAEASRFNHFSTLATWLHDGGYRTGYVGKYLLPYGRFDINKDHVRNVKDAQYIPPGWDDWHVLVSPLHTLSPIHNMYTYTINNNGDLTQYNDQSKHSNYQTDVLADHAVDFIKVTNRKNPFFLVVAPTAPHLETTSVSLWGWDIRPAPRHADTVKENLPLSPSFNEQDLSDKPYMTQGYYPPILHIESLILQMRYNHRLESLRAIDDLLGKTITALEENEELDTTVLIFTSDNGYMLGEHRLIEKGLPYEESIRVPLYIRAPGFTKGQTVEKLVLNNDLAPTLAELAGVDLPHLVDGTSLVPLLQNPHVNWRKRFLIESFETPYYQNDTSYLAIRTAPDSKISSSQLFITYQDNTNSKEHYNLLNDPFQLESIHNDNSSISVSQRSKLSQWISKLKTCENEVCKQIEFSD